VSLKFDLARTAKSSVFAKSRGSHDIALIASKSRLQTSAHH
jgi:hypothetical protein